MHRMKRIFLVASALSVSMMTAAGMAQAPAAAAPPPSTQPAAKAAAVAPQAVVAKIALISFEEAVLATNEGQRVLQDMQKKYLPKKAEIESLSKEVDTLKQQYQSAQATLSDADKAERLRTIDTKEKALNRETEDTQTAYTAEAQEAINKVAQKMGPTVVKYVQQNGYTLLLDSTGQQGQGGGLNVMWAAQGTDISQVVVDAYNASSGVPAPVPTAPAPAPAARQPGATAPKQ
jgi:Skp family chaperone for outer membrane proteins